MMKANNPISILSLVPYRYINITRHQVMLFARRTYPVLLGNHNVKASVCPVTLLCTIITFLHSLAREELILWSCSETVIKSWSLLLIDPK
jgi:hypothetical protein